MADVGATYTQVRVLAIDRDCLRFLWRCDGEMVECRVASYLFGGVWCAGGGTCALRRALVEFGASAVVGEAVSRPICVDESLGNCPVGSGAVRFVWDVRGCCAWDRWISSL